MDFTFALSAIIFTLLAIVVATSVFNGSSSVNGFFGQRCGDGSTEGSDQPTPKQNGHAPEEKTKKENLEEDWCETSGSSHDHWDVVKSEEAYPKLQPEEHSSSTSSLSISRPDSRNISLDSSFEASSGRSCGSFFGLSDKELLKCAFSHPQSEGATESPGISDHVETNIDNSLRYIPGKARSHHLQMMMSKEELEEEQRVQREQLATIFQLLKDNKETFGEVSEGDMEEQLRLYSI